MREAARIAPRCHPIAQIRQRLVPVRLWAVEAASARPADIFSLLLMKYLCASGTKTRVLKVFALFIESGIIYCLILVCLGICTIYSI